jgi:hypothetical protein
MSTCTCPSPPFAPPLSLPPPPPQGPQLAQGVGANALLAIVAAVLVAMLVCCAMRLCLSQQQKFATQPSAEELTPAKLPPMVQIRLPPQQKPASIEQNLERDPVSVLWNGLKGGSPGCGCNVS